jgi:predicted exporter
MQPKTGARIGRTSRHALWIWLAFTVAAALVAGRSRYIADLSAFLPAAPTRGQALLLEQLKSGAAARLVLIGIEGGDSAVRADASRALATALRAGGRFDTVSNGDGADFQATGRFLFDHRYLLSPAVDAKRFEVEGLRAAIDDTLSLLGTPAGALVKPVLWRDPTGETVRLAESMLPTHAPRMENGVWVSRDAPRAVLIATTRAPGADLDAQERALEAVHAAFAPLAARGLRVELSGAPVFAVASRAQIKAEVARLAVLGSVVVIGLLLVAFGSLGSVLVATLPVATGVLAGIAAVSLGFGYVHGMTLGFGTTRIGEAVDYAIYYLVQTRRASTPPQPRAVDAAPDRGARHWLETSWPTVRLGLLTSLCGFAALVVSGFPGLAQLGVYSIVGLTAAALTTRYVFPVIAPDGAPGRGLRRQLGRLSGRAAAALPRARRALLLLAALALAAALALPSPWHGDIGSLSTIQPLEFALDTALRRDVGAPDAGTLVALPALDETRALEAAETAGQRLDGLVAAGILEGYASPARLLPSPATQLARRAALPDAATLRARLVVATADGPLPAGRLEPFIADVQAARVEPPLDHAVLEGTPLATAVDALLVRGTGGRPWHAVLQLQGGPRGIDPAAVRAALADVPGAEVIAVRDELDALYAHYLREATLQALAGAAAVCALLALRLRSTPRLVRVIEPIAAAVILVLAAAAAFGASLGILHLVGLLLVVAIGSNYALFFDHLGEREAARVRHAAPGLEASATAAEEEEDTLASLALANLTTVGSFGLLAASGIPVLHAIGSVVAPGTLLCLVLSAAFIGREPRLRAVSAAGAHGTMPPPI